MDWRNAGGVRMIYTLPTENVADDVTPTLSTGTADVENPLANLTDGDPAHPFMTTDSAGIRVVWDYTGPQRIDYVSMPMHGIPAGTLALFQMHTADSWGSPDLSGVFTIDTFLDDFPRVQILDVTGVGGYLVGGYRFASLFVPTHSVGITKIGDIEFWTQKRTLQYSLRVGVRAPRERLTVVHPRQDGGRFVYDRQLLNRMIVGSVREDIADWDKLEALYAAARGATKPFLVNVEAAREHYYVWWSGRTLNPSIPDVVKTRNVPIEWTELGRGMPL